MNTNGQWFLLGHVFPITPVKKRTFPYFRYSSSPKSSLSNINRNPLIMAPDGHFEYLIRRGTAAG